MIDRHFFRNRRHLDDILRLRIIDVFSFRILRVLSVYQEFDIQSSEFDKKGLHIIGLINEWTRDGKKIKGTDKNLGGTMRLGSYDAKLLKNSMIQKIYGKNLIKERHRHRYEVNVDFKEKFEKNGMNFSGLSPVRVKSADAIGVSKSTTLNCWYYLNNPGELNYSVSWYWTPPIRKSSDLDFRCWDKSRLMSRPEFPTKTVHFFRYRKIDPDGDRRTAWDHKLRIFFDADALQFIKIIAQFIWKKYHHMISKKYKARYKNKIQNMYEF